MLHALPHTPYICKARLFALINATTGKTRLFLLRHTHSPSSPSRRLAVLSAHSQAPVVPQSAMSADLLQPLQVLTQLAVHTVRQDLAILAVHDVALPVEEPVWNLVLSRALDDGDDALEFFGGEFTGAAKSMMLVDGDG